MNQTSTELTNKILEIERKARYAEHAVDYAKKCLEVVNDEVISVLELTNVTIPYMLFVLGNICETMKGHLDERNKTLYNALQKVFRSASIVTRVPSEMFEGGNDES